MASRFPRHNAYVEPRRNWTKVILTILGGVGVVAGTAWWFYWPHHTFTSSVAKILRKGLWAESERGGHEYQKALKHYIEALELAQKEGLDPLSDEYTGIQLKIGQMYEKLSMTSDALMIYSEIASAYLMALTTPGSVTAKERPHLIQKDLRVVLKCVQLNSRDSQMCKMLLMTHLLVAQEEVAKRSASAAKLISMDSPQADAERSYIPDNQVPQVNNVNKKEITLHHNREAWEPFRDELFNTRELYTAICIATGDISSAARSATATTEWMINAECSPSEIMKSQTNLGSIMFLNAQAFKDKITRAEKSGINDPELEFNKGAMQKSVELTVKCYESVLEFSKKLPTTLRRADGMEESIALATYGLGVVKLHNGELEAARNLLRESRLRAKGAGFDELVDNSEEELKKVREELELKLASQKPGDKYLADNQPNDIKFTIELENR
jgi:tetratricopeptide (TPR) repeat protein